MNVDDQYRMVVVLEGRAVLFGVVGITTRPSSAVQGVTSNEYEERLASTQRPISAAG